MPRVIGQTAEAQKRKTTGAKQFRKWTEESLLEEIASRRTQAEADVVKRILRWADEHMDRILWGHGVTWGSAIPILERDSRQHTVVALWSGSAMELRFQYLRASPPFDKREKLTELARRLSDIPGVSLQDDAADRLRPTLAYSKLTNEPAMQHFLSVLTWVVTEIKSASRDAR